MHVFLLISIRITVQVICTSSFFLSFAFSLGECALPHFEVQCKCRLCQSISLSIATIVKQQRFTIKASFSCMAPNVIEQHLLQCTSLCAGLNGTGHVSDGRAGGRESDQVTKLVDYDAPAGLSDQSRLPMATTMTTN